MLPSQLKHLHLMLQWHASSQRAMQLSTEQCQKCRWSVHLQGQIERAQRAIEGTAEGYNIADPPAELFLLARPEKAGVRLELDNEAAFYAILDGLAELGWPPMLAYSDGSQVNCQHDVTAVIHESMLMVKATHRR